MLSFSVGISRPNCKPPLCQQVARYIAATARGSATPPHNFFFIPEMICVQYAVRPTEFKALISEWVGLGEITCHIRQEPRAPCHGENIEGEPGFSSILGSLVRDIRILGYRGLIIRIVGLRY